MKTNDKISSAVLIALMIMGLSLTFLLKAYSQDNSKNKPWLAPESAVQMKNSINAEENTLKQGKDLYAQHCKSCHGVKGRGDGPKAANIEISCGDFTNEEFAKESDGGIFWKVTEGRKPMPSFKDKLSDNERWTVITYIRTLEKKK